MIVYFDVLQMIGPGAILDVVVAILCLRPHFLVPFNNGAKRVAIGTTFESNCHDNIDRAAISTAPATPDCGITEELLSAWTQPWAALTVLVGDAPLVCRNCFVFLMQENFVPL